MNELASLIPLSYMGLRAAASVADHWVQTDCQACDKGLPGWKGRLACGRHVASYVATQGLAVAALFWVAGGRQHWLGLVLGLLLSAVTHYIADRRTPLQKLAELAGKGPFYKRGEVLGSGAYALDQSWHHGWEAIAAVLIAIF